ncbi:MAG: carboxypeptidase-like regulatory domain-containing protein, partial [Prevotella sp.]|nr:carboxypeptidase-like regulatory domain-containing protein [Prevotella sp.]
MKHLKRMIASALMLMVTAIMYAQTIEATGTVVDQTGEAIIGATVMEKGTSNGAITDFDGNFKISVKKGATLVVSYIGFNNQELPAAQGMKITLKEDAQSLQEVVVTGYTTQRKADLTGSVAVVQTKDLKTSSDSDPMRALQGKVAGMTVT